MSLVGVLQAQKLTISEKIERKISVSPYFGVAVFPGNRFQVQDFDVADNNIFQGYPPAPMIGAMLLYQYKKRVYFGADGNFWLTSQDIRDMKIINTGLFVKLIPLTTKKRISPYIIAGLNLTFLNLSQQGQNRQKVETDTSKYGDGIQPEVHDDGRPNVQRAYNQVNLNMQPMLGPMLGVGMDVKINRKFSLFLQAALNSNFSNGGAVNSAFQEDAATAPAPLQYLSLRGGINIRLYKRMKFDIDSQTVPVPDVIAMLYPSEDMGQQQQIMSREGNFAVNIREGLRHSVQVTNQGTEINIQIDQDTTKNPCKVMAVLYDEFGNKVAQTLPDASGNVNFGDLPKGVYNVAFEVQPPCRESSFSYAVNDAEVTKQSNEEYTPKSDSLQYNIEGFVEFKEANASKENIQVMLVDQDKKVIREKQTTRSNGAFAFKNLTPGNYKVVYEVGNPKVQSKLAYTIKDTKDSVIKKEDFAFNTAPKTTSTSRLMSGKMELTDTTIAAYKVNLELVDKYNRVIQKSIPAKDGSFEFIDDQEAKNEIIYDVTDKKLEQQVVEQPLVASMTYEPKVEAAKELAKAQAVAKAAEEARAKPVLVAPIADPEGIKERELYKLYSREGQIKNIEGYGFQIGAFRNLDFVHSIMDKLKSEGYEVYVQSVMSSDINSRFKATQNYRFNRVIVFAGNDELKATEIRGKLTEKGYTIIVKEHFKPKE
ncbi:MAG: SdrD B-like domain-containing protein [Cytophagales bacterium]|nr:SdrD B-like domain-containing protein [Cytophagales bacterium]